MRPPLLRILEALLARSRADGGITLDDFAEVVTAIEVSNAEIEEVITVFEEQGGVIHSPAGAVGAHSQRLKAVLMAARELAPKLGRPAKPTEIADHLGIDVALVRAALAVGRVMGR